MNKGFISIIGIAILSIAIVIGSVFVANELRTPQPLRFVSPKSDNLGTATQSGNFPTSTNNFQDGDVINAGDWNRIEETIGITNSASSTSLTYKLTSATSTDPGHKHTTNGISGVINPLQGGTGTSTLTANNVILGNGTSSVQFVAPGASGNILTSIGTTWVSSSTAASLIDVQTFTASSTWTKPGSGTIVFIQLWGAGGSGGATSTGGGGGGGGGYNQLWIPFSSLSATSSVVIGNGGAGKTAGTGTGNTGGNTTFGTLLTAYGGAGGGYGGGGGGGMNATGTAGGADGGAGGGYVGGTGGSSVAGGDSFGGGGGGGDRENGTAGGGSYYGGAGGGGGGAGNGATTNGTSIYGGGGGGGASVSGTPGAGGISNQGGNGSAGVSGSSNSSAGTQPGGGSGGSVSGTTGNGGNGKAVITVF